VSDAHDRSVARQTVIVIALILATLLGLALVWSVRLVLTWIVIAAFFAVALDPLVDRAQRRYLHRRTVATLVVFLVTFLVLCGLGALIVVPLVEQVPQFAERAPGIYHDTMAGKGPIGQLLKQTHLQQYVQSHEAQLRAYASKAAKPSFGLARQALQSIGGLLTVVVLAYLMVVEKPLITAKVLAVAGDARAEQLRRIGRECSRAITGYIRGNLLISLIIGVLTFFVLLLLGVPFAGVIALLVGIADLIPLVGATLGGIVAVAAGFLHSTKAGIIVLIFYVVYQQLENHLLQPVIMRSTVRLNPLTVLVAALLAADLGGLVGALLAIPAASIVSVLLREFVPAFRRGSPPPDSSSAGGAMRAVGRGWRRLFHKRS
jgi:predicted PurR-regulated permease PerM